MSDAPKPFDFSQFVPGFDFLKNLTSANASAAAPGAPGLANWVAPTLSVEEVDKRIQELKTVQFWLEQNVHALKATLQALEVQKMTLSTLRSMNVQMDDLAGVFTRQAAAAQEAAAAQAAPRKAEAPAETPKAEAPAAAAPGAVDPLQWWGALTQQFQHIAQSALQEASQLKMPALVPDAGAATPAAGKASAKTARKPAAPRKQAAR